MFDVFGPRLVPAIAPAAGELYLPWLEVATLDLPILPINSSVFKTKLFADEVGNPNSVIRRLFELLPLSIKSLTKFWFDWFPINPYLGINLLWIKEFYAPAAKLLELFWLFTPTKTSSNLLLLLFNGGCIPSFLGLPPKAAFNFEDELLYLNF